MKYSPILLLHISAGTLGFLSGATAIVLRKGSRRHAVAGDVFVVTMMTMAASGSYMAMMKSEMGNFLGGIFTFYLVATAWWTARRAQEKPAMPDWIAFLCVAAVFAANLIYGVAAVRSITGKIAGYPPGIYFFGASIALIAAVGDLRLLLGRTLSSTQRIARHLWRMCYALFVASGSIFLARAHLFPVILRKTGVLLILSFAPIALMIFWLIRIRRTGVFGRKPAIPVRGAAREFASNSSTLRSVPVAAGDRARV